MNMGKKKIALCLAVLIVVTIGYLIYAGGHYGKKELPAGDGTAAKAEYKTETIQEGYGDTVVKAGDLISVNYVGSYEDGTIFSSNLASGIPYELFIGKGEALKGWDEGLIGMVAGEKRKLVVPPGYGGSGVAASGRENSVLYYEIELLDIK